MGERQLLSVNSQIILDTNSISSKSNIRQTSELRKRLDYKGIRRISDKRYPFERVYEVLTNLHEKPLIHWALFFLIFIMFNLLVSIIFAGLYYIDPDGITPPTHHFIDSFWLALGIMTHLAAPVIETKTLAHVLSNIQAFISTMSTAVITGLVFSRFSQPFVNVLYSESCIYTPCYHTRDAAIIFRVANALGNPLVNAKIRVFYAINEYINGENIRQLYPLKLMRDKSLMFKLSWTIVHLIDEHSPLFKQSRKSLTMGDAEFVCLFSGTDQSFGKVVHIHKEYVLAEDCNWGSHKFVDTIYKLPTGERVFDISKFNGLEELSEPKQLNNLVLQGDEQKLGEGCHHCLLEKLENGKHSLSKM